MELRAKYDLSDLEELVLGHLDGQGFKQVHGTEIELEAPENGDLAGIKLWVTITSVESAFLPPPDPAPAPNPVKGKGRNSPEALAKARATRAANRKAKEEIQTQAPAVITEAEQVVEEAVAAANPFR